MGHQLHVVAVADGYVEDAVVLLVVLQCVAELAYLVFDVFVHVLPLCRQSQVGGEGSCHVEGSAPAEEFAALGHGLVDCPSVEGEATACGLAQGQRLAVLYVALALVQSVVGVHRYAQLLGQPDGRERGVLADFNFADVGDDFLLLVLHRNPCAELLALGGSGDEGADGARVVALAYGNPVAHALLVGGFRAVEGGRGLVVDAHLAAVGDEGSIHRAGFAADDQILGAAHVVPVRCALAHRGVVRLSALSLCGLLRREEAHLLRGECRLHLQRPHLRAVAHGHVRLHLRGAEHLRVFLRDAQSDPYLGGRVRGLIQHGVGLQRGEGGGHRQRLVVGVGHGHPHQRAVQGHLDAFLLGVVDVVFIFLFAELLHVFLRVAALAERRREVVAVLAVQVEHEPLALLHLRVRCQRLERGVHQLGGAALAGHVHRYGSLRLVFHFHDHVALRHRERAGLRRGIPLEVLDGFFDNGFGLLLQVAAVRRQLRHRMGGLACVVARQFLAVIEHKIASGHCLSAPAVAYVYVF